MAARGPLKRCLIIEGEIGAGKSTLQYRIASELKSLGYTVCVIPEPVNKWREVGILERFYRDPARYALEFQWYIFVTRIAAAREAYEKNPNVDFYLLERSVLTDRHVFMKIQEELVGPQTMKMYTDGFDLYKLLMPFDLSEATYCYLKPDIEVCMGRVARRNRKEETQVAQEVKAPSQEVKVAQRPAGVTIEYQTRLRHAHEVLFEGKHEAMERPFPLSSVITITGTHANADFTETSIDSHRTVSAILTIILSTMGILSMKTERKTN